MGAVFVVLWGFFGCFNLFDIQSCLRARLPDFLPSDFRSTSVCRVVLVHEKMLLRLVGGGSAVLIPSPAQMGADTGPEQRELGLRS